MRRILIIAFSVIVLAVLFVVLCTFVRRPYEIVMLDRFGRLVEEPARIAYNWHLKWPTDSIIRIDRRLHLYPSGLQQVNTASSEPIAVRYVAAWRITNPKLFYTRTGGNDRRAEQNISTQLTALVNSKLGSLPLDAIFNVDESKVQTEKLLEEIRHEANHGAAAAGKEHKDAPGTQPEATLQGLEQQGIEIVKVSFARLAFPPNNAQSIYARMAAERNTLAERFRAEGMKESSNIITAARKEASNIRAGSTAKAQETRGEGDREALKILAGVQTSAEAREFYKFWKAMEFYRASLTKNSVLVLPSNHELLRNLFDAPPPAPATKQAGTN